MAVVFLWIANLMQILSAIRPTWVEQTPPGHVYKPSGNNYFEIQGLKYSKTWVNRLDDSRGSAIELPATK
jgi:hypothetical protein